MQDISPLLTQPITDTLHISRAVITTSSKKYRTELSIKNNPASFGKFIKKQLYNSDFMKTLTFNGASCSNEQDAAAMFAYYFESVYSCSSTFIP